MLNASELLYCVDKSNQPITPQIRSLVHEKGIWHRSTEIWIFSPSFSHVLCNKRSDLKDTNPGLLDCTFGGHVLSGEDQITNAINELAEELSLKVKMGELAFQEIVQDQDLHHFVYRYTYVYFGDISELIFEREEIDKLFWFLSSDLLSLYQSRADSGWVYRPKGFNFLRKLHKS